MNAILKSPAQPRPDYIAWLDGVRGFAALWVFVGHIRKLSGLGYVPVLSNAGAAVDLFMILSGFLMLHHAIERQRNEPWEAPRTWLVFWTRRLFRIVPVYFLLLAIALIFGEPLAGIRESIAHHWPEAATFYTRYSDHSLANILTHVSFVYGLLPHYSCNTALSDWSLAIEMQYYFIFPLLMLLVARWGIYGPAFLTVALSLALEFGFRDYWGHFDLPTPLPFKLYVFWLGMLAAWGYWRGNMRGPLCAALGLALLYLFRNPDIEGILRVLLTLGFFALLAKESTPVYPWLRHAMDAVRKFLAGKLSRFLADTSYSVYLLHHLILIPVAGYLIRQEWFLNLNGFFRFALCCAIVVPSVYLTGWVLHRAVEKPGIRLGKSAIAFLKKKA